MFNKLNNKITPNNIKFFINYINNFTKSKKEKFWSNFSKQQVLYLFKQAAYRVPAYKDFLRKNKINPEKIKTIEDFRLVPPTNKENYLHQYPYGMLMWDGDIKKPFTIHATSGSTGEPTYFSRNLKNDLLRVIFLLDFLNYNKIHRDSSTLFIITFGMGIWSAGMGIYTAAYLASKLLDLPISIITPGVNKIEVLKIFKNLLNRFDNVIIAGYPPFVKDVIDEAEEAGINLKKNPFRFIFTGESFPEELRDYLAKKVYIQNIYTDLINTYGTSEFGATGLETPLSVLITRLAIRNNKIFQELFGETLVKPTLVQYNPLFVNFENINDELLVTGDNVIPLIRYQIGDYGGMFSFSDIYKIFKKYNIDLDKEIQKNKLQKYINKNLPFVYVKTRKNLTATFYGILIYPDFIKIALLDNKVSKLLTGKFTLITKYDKRKNQYLEINLELKPNVKISNSDKKFILEKIVKTLKAKSSEYRELSNNLKEKANPKLKFWPYQHPTYFKPGNKQKWVISL